MFRANGAYIVNCGACVDLRLCGALCIPTRNCDILPLFTKTAGAHRDNPLGDVFVDRGITKCIGAYDPDGAYPN